MRSDDLPTLVGGDGNTVLRLSADAETRGPSTGNSITSNSDDKTQTL